ncbi:CBR-SLO-2 protein [Aphelenchoides avenae]|nr:CBR-SLO-2 protein [Aphelenchus avenae]
MVKTYPPINAYVHAHTTVCHILKEKREFCCLEIDKPCAHSNTKSPHDFKWRTPALIVAADRTSSGLVNLLLPLRAYYRPVHDLHPIILLLELENDAKPHDAFLDLIAWFPDVYWLPGRISSLDNLLKAGIFLAEHVIVVKESAALESDYLADCSTILTVQKIHRMFPKLRLISELTHSTNMRFMEFDAQDAYALQQSKVEKRERSRGSNLAFMFRLPFAAGNVFSAHMLDRLLYQAFDKNYLVSFLKIFLGIDQSPGSGYLSSFKVVKEDAWIGTYGRLYQQLCSTVADIPIEVENGTRDKGISFVIINPPADLHLQEGDVV